MPFWAAAAAVGGALLSSNSSRKASKASARGQNAALRYTQQAAEQARAAAIPLFDASQRNALAGFQGALDIQGQFAPAQIDAFQQGNMQAQNTMRGGLDPQIAAILGGNVDLSGLQAQQVQTPDPSMFQQQLPEFSQMIDVLPSQAAQYIPGAAEELQQRATQNADPTRYPDPNAQYVGMDTIQQRMADEYARTGEYNHPMGMQGWKTDPGWASDPLFQNLSSGNPQTAWGGPNILGGG